jgi:hypothetical protein
VKFLAILKDSFREAVDVRVGYLLVVMSCALILVFASLSFTPRPCREVLPKLAMQLNTPTGGRDDQPAGSLDPNLVFFRVVAVEPQGGTPDRPQSPLRFTVLAQFADPADSARVRESPGEAEDLIRRRFGRVGTTRAFEVTEVRPALPGDPLVPPEDVRHDACFQVATRPTAGTLRIWPHDSSLLFGALPLAGLWQFIGQGQAVTQEEAAPPLGVQVYVFQQMLVNNMGAWVAVLVSVFVTAFFVPNMLQKGTLDLLLVKPIQRWRLLVYKYLGGLTFIFLNGCLAVVGVWFVLGLRSGIWCHHLLLLVPVLTFFFAILYAVSTLVGVLTRSPITAILITSLVWALLYGVGQAHHYFHEQEPAPGLATAGAATSREQTAVAVIDACHFILPRTTDLDALTSDLRERDLIPELGGEERVRLGPRVHWGESLTVSGAFIAVLLGLACVRFSLKDY